MITLQTKLSLTNFRATTENGYEYEVVRPNVRLKIKSEPNKNSDTDVTWVFPIRTLGVSSDEDVKNCMNDFTALVHNQRFNLKLPLNNIKLLIEAVEEA